jgi:hypothetical protein
MPPCYLSCLMNMYVWIAVQVGNIVKESRVDQHQLVEHHRVPHPHPTVPVVLEIVVYQYHNSATSAAEKIKEFCTILID